MDSIEEMTQGWWRPSPGSTYPLLEGLEQEGLVKKGPDGKYTLTEKSRSEWQIGMPGGSPQNVEGMLREINGYASYFEDLSKSDRAKIAPHAPEIKRTAERLMALVQDIGEKT